MMTTSFCLGVLAAHGRRDTGVTMRWMAIFSWGGAQRLQPVLHVRPLHQEPGPFRKELEIAPPAGCHMAVPGQVLAVEGRQQRQACGSAHPQPPDPVLAEMGMQQFRPAAPQEAFRLQFPAEMAAAQPPLQPA